MKEKYAALKGVDKAPLLAPYEKEDLAARKFMYDAIDDTRITYPTEPLAAAQLPMRIDLGGLIAILEFHPGHTPTDLIVRVPEYDVVFTGDLLFNQGYPVAMDANMIAWRAVLDRLARFGRNTRFVPGHKDTCGLETVREQAALMDDLRGHAEKMIQSGASAQEAGRRYTVPKRFTSYKVTWDMCIGAAMRSYYARLTR